MELSNTQLRSDNFELCRICMFEPESNRDIKIFDIFSYNNEGIILSAQIAELFGFIVCKDDVKPKIICENCYNSIVRWVEFKKKVRESQIKIETLEVIKEEEL